MYKTALPNSSSDPEPHVVQELNRALQQHDIVLSQRQQNMLATHFLLLQKWNRMHNLTRVCTLQQAIVKHYIDSLCPLIKLQPPQEMLDVGSGAGFPGLIAAVLWPQASVRLLDSCRKKCSFLQTAVAYMQLSNVCVQHGKAPHCDLAPCVLSRATFCVQHLCVAIQCLQDNSAGYVALWVTPQQIIPIRKYIESLHVSIENIITYSLAKKHTRAVVVVRRCSACDL